MFGMGLKTLASVVQVLESGSPGSSWVKGKTNHLQGRTATHWPFPFEVVHQNYEGTGKQG